MELEAKIVTEKAVEQIAAELAGVQRAINKLASNVLVLGIIIATIGLAIVISLI